MGVLEIALISFIAVNSALGVLSFFTTRRN
ncbi:hypothetical protein MNBD_ALPHA05-230 [hydrothermal vent metagenome]|jgi:hypothetical protein|uniref:Uncharacterized protein n=1 Tax=hydrothermal vent metagenome TaxID=652676 RepID=A0A3B0RXK8_9ZZZZ